MLASIFISVLQNRSFLSRKICFFTKICICLQNVIIFAKINSIFANLKNKLQTLRWKFSSIAISRYKYLIFLYFVQIYLSKISAEYWHVCECSMCVHWQERREVGGRLGKMKSEFLCSGPVQHPICQIDEELEGVKGWGKMEGEERKKVIHQWKFIRADKKKSPECEQSLPRFCALACCTVRLWMLHWENITKIYIKPELTA